MRRIQTAEETVKQANEWVSDFRIWATEGGTGGGIGVSECDELATLIERLVEWKPKPVPCDVGRYPCVHEERMPTAA